jgi:broad specificity phosphatase PhoE
MLIFVRHGERLDQVTPQPPGTKIDFSYDPPLTSEGMR